MKSLAHIALLVISCALASHASLALAASAPAAPMPETVVSDHCSWDHPGVNPFMGELVPAVDRYRDIPPEVRERLKARMQKLDYDDMVSIRRDSIDGRGGYDYGTTISDMHFGTNRLCHSVTRSSWSPQMQERGLVYCESGHCILVPTVCRNVSRISRHGVGPAVAAAPEAPLLAAAGDALPIDWMGPAGAGPLADADAPPAGMLGGAGPAADGVSAPGAFRGAFASPMGGSAGYAGATTVAGTPGPTPGGVENAPTPTVGVVITTPVPEPGTWAMVLLGLAAVALAGMRRDRSGRK